MIESFKQEILKHGDKFKILPITRLKDLKKDIEDFKNNEELNDFQKFITDSLYQFELPAADFETGKTFKEFPRTLKNKTRSLGMDSWIAAIPRNIKILFENYEDRGL